MAETAGSLRTAIQRRIRDPNGTAHAAADVLTILSAAQRLVNAKTHAVLSQSSAAIRFKNRPLISLTTNLTNVVHVESVRTVEGKRELQRIDWRSLVHHDPNWFRRAGDTPRVWATVGEDQLLVWPASRLSAADIFVVYTGVTPALTADATLTVLPDQHMPAVLDIAEACLLTRQRLFGSLKQATEKQALRADAGLAR